MKTKKHFFLTLSLFAPILITKTLNVNYATSPFNSYSSEPVVEIIDSSVKVNEDSFSFDYTYKNTNNDPMIRAFVKIEHAMFLPPEKYVMSINEGENQPFTANSSTAPGVTFTSGDSYSIHIYTEHSSTGTDAYDNLWITLGKDAAPSITISNIYTDTDNIILTYSYERGQPAINERGYVDITNTSEMKTNTVLLMPGKDEELVLDSSSVPGVPFNPGDNFELVFYTVDSMIQDVNFKEEVTLKAEEPELIINSLVGSERSIILDYTYVQGIPSDKEKGYIDIENTTRKETATLDLLAGTNETIIFDENNSSVQGVSFNPGDIFKVTLYTQGAAEGNDKNISITIQLDFETPVVEIISLTSTTHSIDLEYKYDMGGPSDKEEISIYVENTTKKENGIYKSPVLPGKNEVVTLDYSTVPGVSFNPNDGFNITITATNNASGDVASDTKSTILNTINPVVKINSLSPTSDSITVNYLYQQGEPANNEKAFIEVTNTTKSITERYNGSIPITNSGTIILDSTNVSNVPFEPGDNFEVKLSTMNATGQDESNSALTTLLSIDPIVSIDELNATDHNINMKYTYIRGNPVGNEQAIIEVKNVNDTNEKGTYNGSIIWGSQQEIILDNSTVSGVTFDSNEEFEITLKTNNASGNDIFDTKKISIGGVAPIVSINNVNATPDSLIVTYSWTPGSAGRQEKGSILVENKTTGENGEIAVNTQGVNEIIIDELVVDGVSFNEGDNFKITFYIDDGNDIVSDWTEETLLISPKWGLEANYDDINNPTLLTLKIYWVEPNSADDALITISLFDSQGGLLDSYNNVQIDQEIVINLESYSDLDDIKISHVWTNLAANYQSPPITTPFDELKGNVKEFNPPIHTSSFNGMTILWITLASVGGLVALGGIGWAIWNKKKTPI